MKLPAEFAQASTGLPQESGVQNLIEFFKLLDSVGEGFSSAASLTRQQEETVYGNTLSSLENLIAESDNIDNHSFYQGELDKLGTDANFQSAILERPDLGLRFDEAQRVSSQRGQSLSDVKIIGQQLVNELYGDTNFFGIAHKDLTPKNLMKMWEDLDPDYRKHGLFLKLKKDQDRIAGIQRKLNALFGGKEDGSYQKLPNLKFNYTTKNDAGEEISQEISFDEFTQQVHKYSSDLQGFVKSAIDDDYLSFDEASNFINMDYGTFATMHQNNQTKYKGIWEDSSKLRDNTINKLITIMDEKVGTDWEAQANQVLKEMELDNETQQLFMQLLGSSEKLDLEGKMPFIMSGNPVSDLQSLMTEMREGTITSGELRQILQSQSTILYERAKNAEEGLINWGGGEFLFGYTPVVPFSVEDLEDIDGETDDVDGEEVIEEEVVDKVDLKTLEKDINFSDPDSIEAFKNNYNITDEEFQTLFPDKKISVEDKAGTFLSLKGTRELPRGTSSIDNINKKVYDYTSNEVVPIPEVIREGSIQGSLEAIKRKEEGNNFYKHSSGKDQQITYGRRIMIQRDFDDEIIKLNENMLNLTRLLASDEYIQNLPSKSSLLGTGFNIATFGLSDAIGITDTGKTTDSNIHEESIKRHEVDISHLLNLKYVPTTNEEFDMYNNLIDTLSKKLREEHKRLVSGKVKGNTGEAVKYLSKLKIQLKRLHKKGGFSK